MRFALAAGLVATIALPGGVATAAVPSEHTLYEGRTLQNVALAFQVRPNATREIQRLALRYRSACSDGETLRSTFRFAPIDLKGSRFSRAGTVSGMLTDGRAYTSKVRVTGRFAAGLVDASATGTFALSTRIPDGKGGVARCSTGALTWAAGPATD